MIFKRGGFFLFGFFWPLVHVEGQKISPFLHSRGKKEKAPSPVSSLSFSAVIYCYFMSLLLPPFPSFPSCWDFHPSAWKVTEMYLQKFAPSIARCFLMPSILAFIVQGSKKAKMFFVFQALHYRQKNLTVAEKIVFTCFCRDNTLYFYKLATFPFEMSWNDNVQ